MKIPHDEEVEAKIRDRPEMGYTRTEYRAFPLKEMKDIC